MNIKDDMQNDFKNSTGDYAHAVAGGAVASIPGIGNLASEIFHTIISSPLEKRKEQWMIRIAEGLEELQNKADNFNVETLCENDLFISILNRASQLAISNHQEEKLNALRNAIMNTALDIDIDENEQMMFLNLVDSTTPWHLRLIHYFENPEQRYKERNIKPMDYPMGSPVTPLLDFYAELKGKESFINLIVKDLYNNGLFNTENLNAMMTSNGMYASRLTEYGERFLQFISAPEL